MHKSVKKNCGLVQVLLLRLGDVRLDAEGLPERRISNRLCTLAL